MSIFSDIGRELLTQDNACTSDPIFMVQRHCRQYGFDPSYSDNVVWLYSDESIEVDAEQAKALEDQYDLTGHEPDNRTRTSYQDSWENVQPFFTRAAAEGYIARNAHRLRGRLCIEPRIYVESGYRNEEWIALRAAFIAAAKAEEGNQ